MEAASQPLDHPSGRSLRIILWILILLAAGEFVVRGPVRYLQEPSNWNDLSQNYTASKLWLKGQSPADPRNFVALWKQEGHSRLELDDIRTHLAPPLGGLVVLAPVAAVPWAIAKPLWLGILLLSFAATVAALALTSGFRWNEPRTLAVVAGSLALAPFHTGIASGNSSILVIALSALAIWAAHRGRDVASGVLFGLACALKPQIGAFLVLYYLVRRRWRLFTIAVACTTALTLVSALNLQMRDGSWVQDYVHNAKGFVTANHIDDFTTANPSRFTLINLQVPFFAITRHSRSANLLAFGATALLLWMWMYCVIGSRKNMPELLSLAAISVITLLPVYHRFYDAALLALPLCWCVDHVLGSSRTIARGALLLMVVFLFPGTAFLQQLDVQGRLPAWLTHSFLWETVVVPHETWALLLLSLVLLYTMSLRLSTAQEV